MSIGATRRELMRLMGAAPFVGPSAMKQLTGIVDGSMAQTVAAAAAVLPMGSPPAGMAILGKALFGDIDKIQRRADSEFYRLAQLRVGGLDADIAALRSVSAVNKANRQIQRDLELLRVLETARTMLWGQA